MDSVTAFSSRTELKTLDGDIQSLISLRDKLLTKEITTRIQEAPGNGSVIDFLLVSRNPVDKESKAETYTRDLLSLGAICSALFRSNTIMSRKMLTLEKEYVSGMIRLEEKMNNKKNPPGQTILGVASYVCLLFMVYVNYRYIMNSEILLT